MEGTSKTNSTLMLELNPEGCFADATSTLGSYLLFAGQSQTEVREIPSCW